MGAARRKFVLIFIIVLSLGVCYEVNSYIYAIITNSVNYSVCDSEDALIAMPEEININVAKAVTVMKTLTDENPNGVELKEIKVDSDSTFYICNNINDRIVIDINVEGVNCFFEEGVLVDETRLTLEPNETKEIIFTVDNDIETKSIWANISAVWSNGSAEFKKRVNFNVDTSVVSTVEDLRIQESSIEAQDNMKEDIIISEDIKEPIVNGLKEEISAKGTDSTVTNKVFDDKMTNELSSEGELNVISVNEDSINDENQELTVTNSSLESKSEESEMTSNTEDVNDEITKHTTRSDNDIEIELEASNDEARKETEEE